MNDLRPAYTQTYAMKSQLVLRDGRKRPQVFVEESDHPLSKEQQRGISVERVLDLYALYGHDLRASGQ
jgi:hypothetical protein